MAQALSLTSRLTLFFTGVAAAVVLGLSWLFMVAADQHFLELDRAALLDKQHLIEDVLVNASSADDTRRRLNEALNHHHGLFAAVRDTQGVTLFQSSGFTALKDVAATPPDHGTSAPPGRATEAGDYRVLRFKARSGHQPAADLDVTVAMETAHHAQFLADLLRRLSVYALLATVVSGWLGWFAARHGLAPLRAMKTRAASVSGHQLGERMPVDAVPVEMAELAGELNRMLDRLQSDFRRLQEFASDLAHELRTPISNLLTQTQVTLSSARDGATYREVLASNAEELQRLARMVSDMLFLAKTERGVDLPHKERFAAAPEVHALCEFYEAVADEKHIALQTHGDGTIDGDRLMFRRAVSNLLSNALRHAPQGGEVCVRISESAPFTDITVENTGKDIDPLVLPRLFDRFYRADPARSHALSEGAGLGLPITRAIVKAHGGDVRVKSANGRTLFILTFLS